MFSWKKSLLQLILFFFLILDIFFLSILLGHRYTTPPKSPTEINVDYSFDHLEKNLNSLVDQKGISSTINILKEALQNKQITMNQCHSFAHLVGHKAYTIFPKNLEKLVNLAESDLLLCGGAYPHGIEAEITITNSNPVATLNTLCDFLIKESPGFPCYHGAGHAFMSDTLDVNKSLLNCDKLPNSGSVEIWSNCYTGVFSEYAFLIAGVDGNTGKPFPGGPKIKLPTSNPLDFCQSLDRKYHYTCASQLGREILNAIQTNNPFAECVKSSYSTDIIIPCIRIVSAVIAQEEFNQIDTVKIPEYILGLSKDLRSAYIEGVAGEYQAFANSGVTKNWKPICSSFSNSDDNKKCSSLFGGN